MMEDVVTEAPPPSRFLEDEDLDAFAPPPTPPLPSPFLLLRSPSHPNPPHLLVLALSPLSRSFLRRLLPPSAAPIGSLFLPEIPLLPSPASNSFHLYSSAAAAANTCFASVQCPIPPNRSRAVAQCLLAALTPRQVLILDCIKTQNYRGRMEVDEDLAFKLETKQWSSDAGGLTFPFLSNRVGYLPSGSVMDGLGAAMMTQCQMKDIKATLLATWPQNGGGLELLKMVFTQLGFEVAAAGTGGGEFSSSNHVHLDLYT